MTGTSHRNGGPRQGQPPEAQGRIGHAHPALVDLQAGPGQDVQVTSTARGRAEGEGPRLDSREAR